MLGALLCGCSAPPKSTGEFRFPAGNYAAAFDAARETLIARRFELERIDARAGVITTKPKPSSGLATPWDTEQSNLSQEVEDLFNRQQRIVRITFEPAEPTGTPPEDVRGVTGDLSARVEVVIERLHQPGWQTEPGAVRFSGYWQDPSLAERGMSPTYAVPFSRDPALAGRLAEEIGARIPAAK